MFGIGMMEIVFILAIALIVIGPDKLPEIARTLGKSFADFKRQADDVKDSFQTGLHQAARKEERENPDKEPLTAQGRAEKALAESGVIPPGDLQKAVAEEATTTEDQVWTKVEQEDGLDDHVAEDDPSHAEEVEVATAEETTNDDDDQRTSNKPTHNA